MKGLSLLALLMVSTVSFAQDVGVATDLSSENPYFSYKCETSKLREELFDGEAYRTYQFTLTVRKDSVDGTISVQSNRPHNAIKEEIEIGKSYDLKIPNSKKFVNVYLNTDGSLDI